MKKVFVLDTNILMSTNGRAITGFADNIVVITTTTLEELDGLKESKGETGYEARQSIREINLLCENYEANKTDEKELPNDILTSGIPINGNGLFKVVIDATEGILPNGFNPEKADNKIIKTVKSLINRYEYPVILITNDISMKIKAEAVGIEVQGYKNDQIDTSERYLGRSTRIIDTEALDILYKEKEIVDESFDYVENEYLMLTDGGNKSALAVYKKGAIKMIEDIKSIKGIAPKNQGQRFILDALLAPPEDIPLVIIDGPAGCGKTLLSLAAALEKTYDDKKHRLYDKILITRSAQLSDEDIGFLPGTLEEKMEPFMAPFLDNLNYLFKTDSGDRVQSDMIVQDLFESNQIEICSLGHIRGRTLPNSFIIIDEAQNLTKLQAKTIVTRAGEGSKLVFMGDLCQIDNPKVDKMNNGLLYLSEHFKGSPLCAQISMTENESVRSALASAALKLLE